MLDDGHGDTDYIGFLERIGADDRAGNLPRDDNERYRVHIGRGNARYSVRCAWAACHHDDADSASRSGIAVSFVHGTLLVSRKHVANLRGIEQRVVHLNRLPTGVSENDFYAFSFQRGYDGLRTGYLLLAIALVFAHCHLLAPYA